MIKRVLKNRALQQRVDYRYLTPIEKPITSLALNSIIELSAETLQYCHTEFAFAPEASVVVGAFAFRVGLEVAGLFFQSLNLKRSDNWVSRWIQKIFLVDMRRDVAFYIKELPPQKSTEMVRYYQPEQLFTNFLKTYTLLNLLRGAHYIISNEQFQNFYSTTFIPLTHHDPLFLLPVGIILLNYLIISRSKHPFLIHLVRNENKLMCFNFAFMSGLLFVASPAVYPLSYLGIALGHLTIRGVREKVQMWRLMFSGLFKTKK